MTAVGHKLRHDAVKLERNFKFGVANGLTQTAKQAADGLNKSMPAIFDAPTAFTQRSVGFTSATRSNLMAKVFVKDQQARYLAMQEAGGVRIPRPGSPIVLPVNRRKNQFGNIPRGALDRAKAKPEVFVASPKDARTKHLPPGIYQRLKSRGKKGLGSERGRKVTTGRGGQNTRVKLLAVFKRKATYRPRLHFAERAIDLVQAKLKPNIEIAVAEAIRTMK